MARHPPLCCCRGESLAGTMTASFGGPGKEGLSGGLAGRARDRVIQPLKKPEFSLSAPFPALGAEGASRTEAPLLFAAE